MARDVETVKPWEGEAAASLGTLPVPGAPQTATTYLNSTKTTVCVAYARALMKSDHSASVRPSRADAASTLSLRVGARSGVHAAVSSQGPAQQPDTLAALVVETSEGARRDLVDALTKLGVNCTESDATETGNQLLHPGLDLLFVSMGPEGAASAAQFFDQARRTAPLIQCVLLRAVDSEKPARRYRFLRIIDHPATPQALQGCARAALEARSALSTLCTSLVGRVGLKDAQRALRVGMSHAALSGCGGNRYAAAALLNVDRKYVQQLARRADEQAHAVAAWRKVGHGGGA